MRRIQILLLFLFASLPGYAQEDVTNPLVVSFVPIPPFAQYGPDGERTGFLIDLAELIGEEIGVEIEFRDVGGITEFVQSQISGDSQMIAGVAQIPPLRANNRFSDVVATENLRPIVLNDRATEFEGVRISGQRVGIVPPALGSQETEFLARNEAIIFQSPEAAVMSLLLGNVDALLIPEPVAYSIARRAGADGRIHFVGEPMRKVSRFVALHESRADLLAPINAALARAEADGRLPALRTRFNITLPAPPPDVLVVGVTNFPPHQFVQDDGIVAGFAVEALQTLAFQLGLQLRFKPITREEWRAGPGPDSYDMLPQTTINDARRARMDFSLPIEQSENSIFMRAEDIGAVAGLDDLIGLKVGAQVDSQVSRVAADVLGSGLVVSADRTELIDDLVEGRLDAVLFSEQVFHQLLDERELRDQIVAIEPPINVIQRAPALRFGLSTVRDRLNAVIPGYLLSDEYAALREKYFGTPVFWTRTMLTAVLVSGGLILLAVLGVFAGLSLRARAAAAAAVAVVHEELDTIFNVATSGIIAFDASGQIVRVNNRARHMLGGTSTPTPFAWPEGIHFLDAETMQPLEASADPMRRALSSHALQNETHLMRRVRGGEDHRYVRIDSASVDSPQSSIQVVLVIDDVSDEERNRQVIERKNRLDALGQLTGGIAHDFNNLLAAQLYAVDLARKAKDATRRDEYLEIAANSIQRGRSLTTRLLAFARRQPGLASVKKTADVFDDFENLVRPMLEAQIEIKLVVDSPDLRHFCDQTQLETALMNLVLNARDAILRSGKGSRIDVRARPVRAPNDDLDTAQQNTAIGHPDGSSFRYIEISVSDNGPGMGDETLARCTDPFFTTKDTNSGTGLGLAMVYGFLRQSDGDLRIYSELDIGTTVQMILPRGTDLGAREEAVPEDEVAKGGGETLLVIDDELQLLVMITHVLEDLGYKVITANSGQDALEKIEGGEAFDLLLTDVVMPGQVGGFELARRVRKLRPGVPVIYTSGYTGFTASEMGEVQAPLLQKPAPPAELAKAIKDAFSKSD